MSLRSLLCVRTALRVARPALVLVAAASGCGKRGNDPGLAPAASALTASAADPAKAAWQYVIATKGTTTIDMPGIKEHIRAETTAAAGSLDVVPFDLAQSRGLVRIDLSPLTTRTFGDTDKDATQTKHARTWLEAVVDGKTNESMRWAEFAIRSVDGLSASDLRGVAPNQDGGDDVRVVTMTVHGDLLVHGHKVPKEDVVEVAFRYPAGSPAVSKPARIDVRSKQPMRVTLREHDVSPRDPAGQLLSWTANLVSKVADTADVSFALSATPGET